jgi:hypothetical protein
MPTRAFIESVMTSDQHEKFTAHRAWLNSFFTSTQEEKRDAILKKLR